ncbi:MAG: glycosyltransferase family 2 protein, partial [Acidimicrobiia bacterium]|nr:glycosyltransferase family 2 protein [Acidimicrobiia bacterium]
MMHPFTGPENDYAPLVNVENDADLPSMTVVIPVFNRAELLERTLAALTHQNYRGPWDVVVADDGSDEDIEAVVSRIATRADLAIAVTRQEHDGYGAGRARNLGAKKASGSVLVFLDADCMPAPGLLARHAVWHTRAS